MTTVLMYGIDAGYHAAAAGLLTSSYAFAALFMRPFTGYLSDHFSKKRLCLIGFAGFILAPLVFVLIRSYPLYLAVRILSGAALALATTTLGAIASLIIPKSRFTEGIGYYGIGMTVGAAIGPAVGLWLIAHWGYSGMFLASAAGSAFAFLLILTLPEIPGAGKGQGRKGTFCLPELLKGMYDRNALFPSVSSLLIMGAQISVAQLLPFYALQKGVQDVSLFFVISAGGTLLVRLTVGMIKKLLSDKAMLMAGYLILVASYLGLYFSKPEGLVFVLIAVLFGLGHGTSSMVLYSMAIIHATPEKIGAANSVYWAAGDLSYAIAPIAWGIYCGQRGYLNVYLISSALVAVSFITFFVFDKGKAQ